MTPDIIDDRAIGFRCEVCGSLEEVAPLKPLLEFHRDMEEAEGAANELAPYQTGELLDEIGRRHPCAILITAGEDRRGRSTMRYRTRGPWCGALGLVSWAHEDMLNDQNDERPDMAPDDEEGEDD
jgi:hypothetical protein